MPTLANIFLEKNTFTEISLGDGAGLKRVIINDNQFGGDLVDLSRATQLIVFNAARNQL